MGDIPVLEGAAAGRARRRHGNGAAAGKKLARYQGRPTLIKGIGVGGEGIGEGEEGLRAVRVACGDGHAVCVLQCGALLSWGRNNCGQLGLGPSVTGFLCDAFSPSLCPPFLPTRDTRLDVRLSRSFPCENPSLRYSRQMEALLGGSVSPGRVTAVDVTCGAFHSICLDSDGHAWTWGARG